VRVGIEAPRNVRVVRSELPLHEETEAAPQQLQISVQAEDAPTTDQPASPVAKKSSKRLNSMMTSIDRADRAQRTGPVLEALRRRGGLGALSPKQPSADTSDYGPLFDHH
jgi:hypothetical protein